MTTGRLAQIVHARGIQGVLFPVLHALDPAIFQPVWGGFACVSFNNHHAAGWVDVVCPDFYHNTDRVITELMHRGHERIGLVLTEGSDAATSGLVSSCYLRYQAMRSRTDRLPICMLPDDPGFQAGRFESWYDKHRPDVVLCRDIRFGERLGAAGREACFLQLGAAVGTGAAGMNELPGEVAAVAMDCLVAKIRRFEKGLGEDTQCHLIKGRWCEGGLAAVEVAQAVA